MCGRFTLTLDPGEVQEMLDLGPYLQVYEPRFNISPSQPIAVVRDPEKKSIEMFRWGLVPFWAKDVAICNRMINARAETLAEKPSFRASFKSKRCLVLADGFFEWSIQNPVSGKNPYYFQVDGGKPFTFAGLYDAWKTEDGDSLYTCTIITCEPNSLLEKYHNRMPVILATQNRWDWLNVSVSEEALLDMLKPYPSQEMSVRKVSKAVNSPQNDSPDILLAEDR